MSLNWLDTRRDETASATGPWGQRLVEFGLSGGFAAAKLLSASQGTEEVEITSEVSGPAEDAADRQP